MTAVPGRRRGRRRPADPDGDHHGTELVPEGQRSDHVERRRKQPAGRRTVVFRLCNTATCMARCATRASASSAEGPTAASTQRHRQRPPRPDDATAYDRRSAGSTKTGARCTVTVPTARCDHRRISATDRARARRELQHHDQHKRNTPSAGAPFSTGTSTRPRRMAGPLRLSATRSVGVSGAYGSTWKLVDATSEPVPVSSRAVQSAAPPGQDGEVRPKLRPPSAPSK